MKRITTEPRAFEDEAQKSFKKSRTDSTETLCKNSEESCLDPAAILFGHSSNFFQTSMNDDSSQTQCLDINMFDPDLFQELDCLKTDLLEELPLNLSLGCLDQTILVNPSSQTGVHDADDLWANLDLEFDSNFFEIDETTFKL